MNEYLVRDHLADLRRDAAAHRRIVSRADKAAPRLAARVSTRLHRRHVAIGCEA